MFRWLALVLLLCGGLAGCASEPPLEKVKVKRTAGSVTLTVPKDFAVEKSQVDVLKKGTGSVLDDGDIAKVDYVAYNGRTGKKFDSSYDSKTPITVGIEEKQSLTGFVKAIKGQRAGARVLAAVAPIDGFGAPRPELGLEKSDTMVVYFHILSEIPTKARGKARDLPDEVPAIVLSKGEPTGFKKSAAAPATISESSAHVAIAGTGPKIRRDGSVMAHYLGQVYPDGAVFDGSWERGAPATFALDGVIKCWQELLPGVKVGSRVVLLCPAQDAYGDTPPQGSKIKAGDSLMFVVDVLDAS